MNVLVAYNGLETGLKESQFALEEAARVAKQYGLGAQRTGPDLDDGRIVILSVVPSGTSTGAQQEFGPHAHDDVAIAHRFLRERGIDAEMKTSVGDPADEIIKEAEKGSYDLLILGRRDLGPVGRLVLGSVSEKVTQRAPCPVVVATKDGVHRFEQARDES